MEIKTLNEMIEFLDEDGESRLSREDVAMVTIVWERAGRVGAEYIAESAYLEGWNDRGRPCPTATICAKEDWSNSVAYKSIQMYKTP